uniref:Uncharacterized protein n=1 Tax=Oryza glumipatula TaxID=40148 RepID=A0A0D9Y3I8_9ORYZ
MESDTKRAPTVLSFSSPRSASAGIALYSAPTVPGAAELPPAAISTAPCSTPRLQPRFCAIAAETPWPPSAWLPPSQPRSGWQGRRRLLIFTAHWSNGTGYRSTRQPDAGSWTSSGQSYANRFNTVRKSKDANCRGISPESSFDEISNDSS